MQSENYIIKELFEKDFEPFCPLMAEIELGSLFDVENNVHNEWLWDKIHRRYGSGTRFFAMYGNGNEIIGLAGVQLEKTLKGVPYLGQKSELTDIVIAEKYRGRGAGTELLKYAEKTAKENGAYCMYAATAAFDYETVAFYGKNGFVPVATLTDVNGPNDEGALYMRKIL